MDKEIRVGQTFTLSEKYKEQVLGVDSVEVIEIIDDPKFGSMYKVKTNTGQSLKLPPSCMNEWFEVTKSSLLKELINEI